MSTDDSISEDVSSLGALSHCHADTNGEGCKESESSEGTSAASGLGLGLGALVQEIQSSGETDPEMWKDCESRNVD
uniref:Uncharacterized protein n=1 Tax=Esox lucius TaxID=8010 RepID=A0A6Q2Z3P9_ESOLU